MQASHPLFKNGCVGEPSREKRGVICLGREFLQLSLKAGTVIIITFLVIIAKVNIEIEIGFDPLKVKIKKKVVR